MSQLGDNFNLAVVCQYHNKKCNLLCCYPGCHERALCSECFSIHDYSHLSNIVPLDSKSHFTPNLFTKKILEIESDITSLKENVKNQENDIYKEVDKFINEIQEKILKKVSTFKNKIVKFIQEFNEHYEKIFMDFLNELKKEYMDIDRIIKIDKEYFSSDRIHNLLLKQQTLENKIIPDLVKKAEIIHSEIKKRFIKIQKNEILMTMDEKFNDLFKVRHVIRCNKFTESIYSELTQTNNNDLQTFMKSLSATNQNYLLQSADVFSFSETFPLPNFQENFKIKEKNNNIIPIIAYAKSLPRSYELKDAHRDIIRCLLLNQEKKSLISCSSDNIIKIWDLYNGKCQNEIQAYHKELFCVCHVWQMNLLLTSGKDLNIRIWDLDNYKCKNIIKQAHTKTIHSLLYLDDGKSFISGSGDGLIKMWDLRTGKNLFIFQGHENSVRSLFFLKHLFCFVSGSNDSSIKIWDLTQNRCKETLYGHESGIFCFEFLQEKNFLFSAGQEKRIRIWDLLDSKNIKNLFGHDDGVFCMKLINEGRNLVSGGGDFLVKFWDFIKEECVLTLKGHKEVVSSILVVRNNLIITGGWDHKVIFWSV